ncbi:peptidase S9 [Geomonas sp. Red32]|uniref:peptidase S9 n=1 Tax=Geomonas sp. Red32 TaxID=2912856 RepID=UPI00202CA921|nr:peptidase S9 [Geomonas sp. Red32]MCM0081724.1 peptidase S9 [Geomonas sp. Red32]
MRSAFLSFVLLLVIASHAYGARLDTSFKFSTIETSHFSIHYHQGLERVAAKTAVMAEEIHARLVPEFLWEPAEKTQLVLIDDSDFTNGLTVTIPYNTVYLQVTPPTLASTLGEYDDWLRELITHEYTHVLTSDPARGYWRVTRAIFGKPLPMLGDPFTELMFLVTAPPNTFMPRWWHEGNAVWGETQFTGEGRGKGSYFDMVFRTAVAEDHLPRVDEINGDPPYWPNGDFPYIFGYRLERYIADRYGKEALGRLSIAHSGRFPYFIGTPPEELTGGKSYADLYDEMLRTMITEQRQRIRELSKAPFTTVTRISSEGEQLSNPRYSPDGSKIAFTRADPNDHTEITVTDHLGHNTVAHIRRRYSDGSIAWSPDGGTIYFTQAEINHGFDVYQDLYSYRFDADATTRLSHSQRLSEIDLSPDGRRFAAVVSSRGSRNLAIFEVPDGEHEPGVRPVTSYLMQRVASPRWSPDGTKICYSLRDNAGHSFLKVYDPKTASDRTILAASNSLEYPVWSRDGSTIFYISDETGVFNLFALRLAEGKSYQVTHLLSGAQQPDPSTDGKGIAISLYNSRGFSIARVDLAPSKWSEQRGPSLPLFRDLPAPLPGVEAAAAAAGSSGAGNAIQPLPAAGATSPAGSSVPVPKAAKVRGMPGEPHPHPVPPLEGEGTSRDSEVAGSAGSVGYAETLGTGRTGGTAGVEEPVGAVPYSPLKTLYPRFWLPRVSADGSGKPVLGAFTAGADVLGYHSYLLAADYSVGRKRGYWDFIYDNDTWYPTFTLQTWGQPFVYGNLLQHGSDYYELNRGFTAQVSVPINALEWNCFFLAGYQLIDQQALSGLEPDGTFNGLNVFRGKRTAVFAGVTFGDALRYPWSISYEEGRNLSLLYHRFDKALGGDVNISEYTAQYQEFLRMPSEPLKHHVVYLRLAGAVSRGADYAQQAFQMGGTPSDLNPYYLRGYPSRSLAGNYLVSGTLEYRMPLFNPMRGPGTFPFFAEKVHGAIFLDSGEVWGNQRSFRGEEIKTGGGVEVRADITLGYWAKLTPAIGVARGFNRGGESQVYLNVYSQY